MQYTGIDDESARDFGRLLKERGQSKRSLKHLHLQGFRTTLSEEVFKAAKQGLQSNSAIEEVTFSHYDCSKTAMKLAGIEGVTCV